MLPKLIIPPPEPPEELPGYGLPDEPVLDWAFVAERMAAATYYWIATVDPDGEPHAVPLQTPYPRVWIPGVISKETII